MRLNFWLAAVLVTVLIMPVGGNGAVAQATGDEVARLRKRVDQLEEQLVNLQVVIGTLESIAKGRIDASVPPAASAPGSPALGGGGTTGALPGDSESRLRTLEMQVQALASQVSRQKSGTPADASDEAGPVSPDGLAQPGAANGPLSPGTGVDQNVGNAPSTGGFGSVSVTDSAATGTAGGDPIGQIITGADTLAPATNTGSADRQGVAGRSAPTKVATLDDSSPAAMYEEAYRYLLRQDYGAAETAFAEFLKRHPRDERAGDAQFWLGESHYVRGQYRRAADAFLKGYKSYPAGAKAPDSLLKLAMSLSRLGQKDAACATFGEVRTRYAKGPAYLTRRTMKEQQRAGC